MMPLISVIMPTYNRKEFHKRAYECFAESTYPYKELLILDDSPEPSSFFRNLYDSRVLYIHLPHRQTIGSKRNFLIEKSQGEIIAHQDDDDIYKPGWLNSITEKLYDFNADFVKLSVFNVYDSISKKRWRWDTRNGSAFHLGTFVIPIGTNDQIKWGYGFSYVYNRKIYDHGIRFPNINLREDYKFVIRARSSGFNMKQVDDLSDCVWHVIHNKSISICLPQIKLL